MCNTDCGFNDTDAVLSCGELMSYCSRYADYVYKDRLMQQVTNYLMPVCGILGLLGYVMMAMTLRKMNLEPTAYVYYQSIVGLELVHMSVMTEAGVIKLLSLPNSYWRVFWIDQMGTGWYIGDCMKLAVTILVACVSLERTIAVVWPLLYPKLNKLYVAWTVVSGSLVVSTVYVPTMVSRVVVYQQNVGYVAVSSDFGQSAVMAGFANAQYGFKLLFSVCIFVLSCSTVYGLCIKARKARSLSVEDRRAWKGTYRLTTLSLVIGISTLADNVCWIVYRYMSLLPVPLLGGQAVVRNSYTDSLAGVDFVMSVSNIKITQGVMGMFVHSGRFYLYLALNKAFRLGFAKAIKANRILAIIGGSSIHPVPKNKSVNTSPHG